MPSYFQSSLKTNRFGYKHTNKFLLDIMAIKNKIEWLLKHVFFSGLDKANQNTCFICIRHIWLQALERLSGSNFAPTLAATIWRLFTSILDQVTEDLRSILPECLQLYDVLPYIMAMYKLHKTNAFHTIFSNIAILLTISSNMILDSFKF